MKNELLNLLCEKSVNVKKEPVYKLVSGKMSDFYVNCKPTSMHPRGMYLIGHLFMEAITGLDVTGVGGLTFGADPISMATAFASELLNRPIKAFSIRKEKKGHGIAKWVEGDMAQGERVVVVDDVVTTGGSTIKAIERAKEQGLEVVRAVILVDRQEENGMENVRACVPDVKAIFTREEVVERYNILKK